MMSLTQKRLLQLPLFFIFVFVIILPLEQSVFPHLPLNLGPVQILPIALTYVALTRNFAKIIIWGILLGMITSLGLPFGFGAAIVAHTWGALAAKGITYTLPIESQFTFALVTCLQSLVARLSWKFLTTSDYHSVPWWRFILDNTPPLLTVAVFAFYLFPIFIIWDTFFENESTAVRDLGSQIKGRHL